MLKKYRAYVTAYDRPEGSLTLWASTQNPHPLRTTLAQTLRLQEGNIRVRRKPDREVAFNEVARYSYRRAYDSHALDMEPGLESTRYFRMPNIHHLPDQYGRINAYPSYPYAACVAIVEVDPETGVVTPLRYVAVHDCGVMINPLLVEGQLHGGVAQGLGGVLHPIQQAFAKHHALQCGFCTPGMVLSVYQLLSENPSASEEEIRKGIAGNLCRCTGYQNIIKAVQEVGAKLSSGGDERGTG